jgi:hypothetical protein
MTRHPRRSAGHTWNQAMMRRSPFSIVCTRYLVY